MDLPRIYTLTEMADLTSAKPIGSPDFQITGINEIHMVRPGDITFVDHPKYYQKALNSAATTIIIDKEVECPPGKSLLVSDDPFRDYNFLTKYFAPISIPNNPLFHASEDAVIGENTIIHNGVVIGSHVSIGKNCIIYPNAVIYDHSVIGDHVIIHANAVIGGDAFYYKRRPQYYEKMHSCGRTILENWVEVGCNATIDRGVSGDTIIGSGTKIDNLVQIGHDNIIGKNCIIASQCGIAGVTRIEDNVILWGQVGVNKDIVIGEGAIVMGKSGVTKSIKGGKVYAGNPAKDNRQWLIEQAMVSRLTETRKTLKENK